MDEEGRDRKHRHLKDFEVTSHVSDQIVDCVVLSLLHCSWEHRVHVDIEKAVKQVLSVWISLSKLNRLVRCSLKPDSFGLFICRSSKNGVEEPSKQMCNLILSLVIALSDNHQGTVSGVE